jgi:hypothetical protein
MGAFVRNEVIQSMDMARIMEFLARLEKDKDEGVAVYFVAGPDGRGAFSNGKYIDVGDRDYFREVFSTGKTTYSEPVISKSTGKPVVVVAIPIKRRGEMVGMMGTSLFISAINRQGHRSKS